MRYYHRYDIVQITQSVDSSEISLVIIISLLSRFYLCILYYLLF